MKRVRDGCAEGGLRSEGAVGGGIRWYGKLALTPRRLDVTYVTSGGMEDGQDTKELVEDFERESVGRRDFDGKANH